MDRKEIVLLMIKFLWFVACLALLLCMVVRSSEQVDGIIVVGGREYTEKISGIMGLLDKKFPEYHRLVSENMFVLVEKSGSNGIIFNFIPGLNITFLGNGKMHDTRLMASMLVHEACHARQHNLRREMTRRERERECYTLQADLLEELEYSSDYVHALRKSIPSDLNKDGRINYLDDLVVMFGHGILEISYEMVP